MKSLIKKVFLGMFLIGFYWLSINITAEWEHKRTLGKIGYCEKLGRIMTDDEKIKIAIEYANNQSIMADIKENGVWTSRFLDVIKYKDADEILKENPDCCRIDSESFISYWTPVFKRIQVRFNLRFIYDGQVITYLRGSLRDHPPNITEIRAAGSIPIGDCGEIVEY